MAVAVQPATAARSYRAAPGAGFSDAQAQRYGSFLEKTVGLGRRVVSPEEIVERARPKKSPIHSAFTWDDQIAAGRYRIEEARHLVNHIVIPRETPEGSAQVRAFHNVIQPVEGDEPAARGYTSQKRVWARPELAEQVVARAMRELQGWRDRYATYSYLRGAVEAVGEILEEAA